MANYKLNEQMVAGMSEGDKETILSLYLHRCLTPSLIVKHLYRIDGIQEETQYFENLVYRASSVGRQKVKPLFLLQIESEKELPRCCHRGRVQ